MIIGLGKTGLSCARYFARREIAFAVQDHRPSAASLAELREIAPMVKCTPLDAKDLCVAEEIIVSPGVPLATPEIVQARVAGVPVTGDINMFLQQADKPVVAITGSNGKSTVTALLGDILKHAGRKPGVGGNIGTPCLDLLAGDFDCYVLEVSSYQLEVVEHAGCDIAVVLNLSPDHLDRYASVDDYYRAKARIYRGAGVALVNRECRQTLLPGSALSSANDTGLLSFGSDAPEDAGSYGFVDKAGREYLAQGDECVMATHELGLKGRHNALNALAALALADALAVPRSESLVVLGQFPGLPHRCERVAVPGCHVPRVDFINDSKATNPGATLAAVNGLAGAYQALVLILGGQGKGADFTVLKSAVSQHVECVHVFGEDAQRISAELDNPCVVSVSTTLEEVLQGLAAELKPDSCVLFSPGCASFDQFENFEHRGIQFKQLLQKVFL